MSFKHYRYQIENWKNLGKIKFFVNCFCNIGLWYRVQSCNCNPRHIKLISFCYCSLKGYRTIHVRQELLPDPCYQADILSIISLSIKQHAKCKVSKAISKVTNCEHYKMSARLFYLKFIKIWKISQFSLRKSLATSVQVHVALVSFPATGRHIRHEATVGVMYIMYEGKAWISEHLHKHENFCLMKKCPQYELERFPYNPINLLCMQKD